MVDGYRNVGDLRRRSSAFVDLALGAVWIRFERGPHVHVQRQGRSLRQQLGRPARILPRPSGHLVKARVPMAVASAALLAVCGCSGSLTGSTHPVLARTVGRPNPSYGGAPKVSRTMHADIGSMLLCAESSKPVRIVSVSAIGKTGEVTVEDIRTRPNPFLDKPVRQAVGVAYGSLASAGMTADSRTILPCKSSDPAAGSEVALELSIPPGTNSATRGWKFTLTDGQHTSTLTFPLGVVLCSSPTMKAPDCHALWKSYAKGS